MYNRKKPIEPLPEENTKVWACATEGCNSWMRDNFTLEQVPTCFICHTPMVSEERMLPQIVNFNSSSSEMAMSSKDAQEV